MLITGNDINIVNAPPREILDKYGGSKTIDEYRSILSTNNKEMNIRMPPLVPIVPFVEEKLINKINIYSNNYNSSENNSQFNSKQVIIKPMGMEKNNSMTGVGINNNSRERLSSNKKNV